MRFLTALVLIASGFAETAWADKDAYLDLARRGWNYELRTLVFGGDKDRPVKIHGRTLAGSALCIVGEKPHAVSLEVLNAFRALEEHVFGKPIPMRYAGADARNCGAGRTVVLRLYSGFPPHHLLSTDLAWMNEVHQIGLPAGRHYAVTSPAMAQTFFGKRGQGLHIMVKQPAHGRPDQLEAAFYKSILIEELFQSFTFGMDILIFERGAGFLSKLQEVPFNLYRMSWESRDFMRALLSSNPSGLCEFDVFMLHAVARSPVEQTVDPGFIDFISTNFNDLQAAARQTLANPQFAPILSRTCSAPI